MASKTAAYGSLGDGAHDPRSERPLVIDTDIHEIAPLTSLLPFLEPKWRHYITQYRWSPDKPNPFAVPAGAGRDRLDAIPAGGGPGGSDIDLLRKHVFDDAGIDCGILAGRLNATGWDPSWPEFKTALMSAYNDWQIQCWLDQENRLLGSIHVNANDPANAAKEIDRLGQHPRMMQVMMYVRDKPLGDRYYHPIYEAAERQGLPVAFHPSGASATAFGYHSYYTEWKILVGPESFMSTLVSLIFNGVFERYPALRVLLVEGGFTWLPSLMNRADQNFRELRLEVPWVKRLPSETIREHARFTTQPMDEISAAELMSYIELMGSDELLCYSSDYPHYDFDSPTQALPSGLPDDLRRKILSGNARKFYGTRLETHLSSLAR